MVNLVARSNRTHTRRTVKGLAVLASVASLALASCSADDSSTTPASVDVTTGDTTSGGAVSSTNPAGGIDPGLQPYIDLAVADLAARLQREPSEITTQSAVLKVWPDASLGCPAKGMQYAQVQTDGSQIVLEADGTAYDYHAGGDTTPFLCLPTGPATSTTTGG